MKRDAPELLKTSWNEVVLVCKDCRKRGSGPGKDLKNKDVVNELRSAFRDARPRPRVMLTGCMGLCPKKAVVVVAADGAVPLRAIGISAAKQVKDAVPLLRGGAGAASEAGLAVPAAAPTTESIVTRN